jgi:hypothetical protein
MRRFSKLLIAAGMAGAIILPTSPASAATTKVDYNIAGVEYAADFAQSSFAGAALSVPKTELGVWKAVVLRDFGNSTTGVDAITGGSFTFKSKRHSFTGSVVGGTFGPAVGSCAKRTVAVHGDLSDDGVFDVTLTRYGSMRTGSCVVYLATVRGTASLAFSA